jgi:hypothetical protein
MLIPLVIAPKEAGYGYIAGTAPNGLVTVDDAPSVRVVDLFERETRLWIRSTVSTVQGRYQFDALPVATKYDVIGRDAVVYNDVISANITPAAY